MRTPRVAQFADSSTQRRSTRRTSSVIPRRMVIPLSPTAWRWARSTTLHSTGTSWAFRPRSRSASINGYSAGWMDPCSGTDFKGCTESQSRFQEVIGQAGS
jgi:hypothetical protein